MNALLRVLAQSCFVGLAVLASVAGCAGSLVEPDDPPATGDVVPFTSGLRIGWDYGTRQRLFDGPASYPRMTRLHSGTLLVSVESAGSSYVLRSTDDGRTWSAPILAAAASNGIMAAVPSLLQLADGVVLLAYNTRPPADNANTTRRFGIKVVASPDEGRTWQPRADVFEGGWAWGEGVWEPAMLQRETGEVLLYFANEAPYPASNDQEISLTRSTDGGKTWSPPETVSYRKGHRDGMPVPLALADGQGIVVAIEDDGLVPGPFKPVLVRLPADGSLDGVVEGSSPRREVALAPSARLPVSAYGGAPYLAQFPDGPTLLSFQSTEGRAGDWSTSTMTVALGDARAAGFNRKSHPFRVPEGRRALWNALFVKDAQTVTALSSTNAFGAAHSELYAIDGHRIDEPVVHYGTPVVDGADAEDVWARGADVFVGAYSDKTARARLAWDEQFLYVRFDVLDGQVFDAAALSEDDDAVEVALAPHLLARDGIVEGVFRLRVEAGGAVAFYGGRGGAWQSAAATGIRAVVSARSQHQNGALRGERYVTEVAIPWERLGGRPAPGAAWGLTVGLANRDARGTLTREWVSGTDIDRPTTWLRTPFER